LGGNPIARVDPIGRDDYFNNKGKFLGSDGNGNLVRIVSGTPPINFMIADSKKVDPNIGKANSMLLSDYLTSADISREERGNVAIAVANLYGGDIGITGIEMGVHSKNTVPAFTVGQKIFLNADFDPKRLSKYDNRNAILNTLLHEFFHKKDNLNKIKTDYLRHAEIYLQQVSNASFSDSGEDYQLGMIASFANHVMNVYTHDPTGDTKAAGKLIEEFNSTFKGTYALTLNVGIGAEDPTMVLSKKGAMSSTINYEKIDAAEE
jgi:hypothetical protein